MRVDRYQGILPEQSNPGGPFIAAQRADKQEVIDQTLAVWRTGASYDVTGRGRTALQGSYSRWSRSAASPLSSAAADVAAMVEKQKQSGRTTSSAR